jgi:hypothetical protein
VAVEGLSICLFLDHNIDPRLAHDLRRRGFDVAYALEIGTERAQDDEHLQWASERGRAVFTVDIGDFRILAEQWAEQGRDHAGIILSIPPPRVAYGEVLRRLLAFLDAVSADEIVDQFRWLDAPQTPGAPVSGG